MYVQFLRSRTDWAQSFEVWAAMSAAASSKATPGQVLIDDLKHIQEFLNTQKRTAKREAFQTMLDNQVKSWVMRINDISILPEEAAAVSDLLSQGPWKDEHREQFSQALASKMECAAAGQSSAAVRRPLQSMNCFASYLTDSDVRYLSDPEVHNVNKVQRLVAKCVALGLHLPKESATKQIIKTGIDCASFLLRYLLIA